MFADENADTSGILYMSNNNIGREEGWNLSEFRLEDREAASSKKPPRKSRLTDSFIAGPIDIGWLSHARKLGVTALWVGLALWYLRGLRKSDSFIVSNRMMEFLNVEPDAKRRALRKLRNAGLIAIQSREKRSPLVTIIVKSAAYTSGKPNERFT
jgi:hypothetical protein